MLSGRQEHRAVMDLAARLQSRGVPLMAETVMITNISSHGARVVGHRSWQTQEPLILTEPIGDFHIDAEVVYCQRLEDDQFAIGLKFATPVEADWSAVAATSGTWRRIVV